MAKQEDKKEELGLYDSLIEIQMKLKAPKSKYNSFGKYNYRSCEDILESVKPLLAEHGIFMYISDKVVMTGNRYHIEATVTVTKGSESLSVTASAREDDDKKGMDGSQISGTSSSYARKYALNGLFLIDDTKDADTDEYHNQRENMTKKSQQQAKPAQTSQPQQQKIQFQEFNPDTELVAEQEMLKCNSYQELMAIWNKYNKINPQYCRKDGILARAFVQRNNELNPKK